MATYENVKSINIQIGGDTQPLLQAIREASQKTKAFEEQLVDINKQLKFNPSNIDNLKKKFEILGNVVSSAENEVKIMKAGLEDARLKWKNGEITEAQFRQVERATQTAIDKFEFYKKQFDEFKQKNQVIVELTNKLDGLVKKEDQLETEIKEVNDALAQTDESADPETYDELTQKSKDLTKELGDTRVEIFTTARDIRKLGTSFRDTGNDVGTFSSKHKDVMDSLADRKPIEEMGNKVRDLESSLTPTALAFAAVGEAMKLVKRGFQELKQKLEDYLENLDQVDVATKQLGKDTEEWLKSIDKSTRQNKTDVAILDVRFRSIEKLNKQIIEGNRLGKDTSKLQLQLSKEVEQLNKDAGQEVLTINKVTGALDQNGKQLSRVREQVLAYAESQYELNTIMELVARRHELEEQIAGRTYQNYAGGLDKLQQELDEVNQKLDQHTTAYENAITSEAEYIKQTDSTRTAVELTVATYSEASEKMKKMSEEVYEKTKENEKKRLDIIVDTNKKINEKSEISLQERIEIMKNNQQALLNYEKNLGTLRQLMFETQDASLREGLQAYLDYIGGEFTEENAQVVNQLVEAWGEGGGDAVKEFVSFYKGQEPEKKMKQAGKDMILAVSDGMNSAKSQVLNTASGIADAIADKLKIKVSISASQSAIDFNPRRYAQGGIITRPTYALVGEMGAEAILPLDKLSSILSETLRQTNGSGGGTYTMNVYPQSMSASEQDRLFRQFDQMFGASTSRRNI